MALHTLPDQLPLEDIQFVIKELTGSHSDTRQLIASGFAVAEYATGQLVPGQPVYKVVGRPTKLHTASLIQLLQQAVANHEAAAQGTVTAMSVNWLEVAKLVMAMLQLWLQRS